MRHTGRSDEAILRPDAQFLVARFGLAGSFQNNKPFLVGVALGGDLILG